MHPRDLSPAALDFLAERHLATLTTLRHDGSPHVVAGGFSYDAATNTARVITFPTSQKARNAALGARAAVSQVDGARWLTLEGPCTVTNDPSRVVAAVAGYAARYRQPKDRPERVTIEIHVDRVLGSRFTS